MGANSVTCPRSHSCSVVELGCESRWSASNPEGSGRGVGASYLATRSEAKSLEHNFPGHCKGDIHRNGDSPRR